MASANTNQNSANDKLVILRGDDTGGAFGRTLYITIEAAAGVSLDGCKAEWIFDGIVKTLDAPLVPGEVREIFYSHNETRCMALGVRYGTFRIIDAAGKVRTLTNTKAVEVTDNVARCYPGASSASFVVVGVGDMKHAEFADLQEKEGMTLKEVGSMVNTLVRKLKGTVAAFAALLAFGAVAAVTPTPDTDFGDIDPFAKLKTVVEASGAISGIDTNAVRDIIREQLATNGIRSVDGAARPLPKYLHALDFSDSYPDAADEYYRSRGDGKTDGGCSAMRDGGYLSRNFDYPFDDRAEFVVRMSASTKRFASVGVAQVGTNLTEAIVTSGKPSRWYKAIPGATVDGINENGVVAEINVCGGDPHEDSWHTTGDIHPLGAVRWVLDNGTSAGMAASNLASRIKFPEGWRQNFHYMVADERETWYVEGGVAYKWQNPLHHFVLTNWRIADKYQPESVLTEAGVERDDLLYSQGANITNVWYTNAYRRETNPPWVSDLREVLAYTNEIFDAWAAHPKEYFRNQLNGGQPWWQSVHTSIYDITNRILRVAVQETDDWYTFAVPSAGGVKVETDPTVPAWAKADNPPVTPSSVNPGYAKNSDYAKSAGTASKATKADEADYAAVADEASWASTAAEADFASEAQNAQFAVSATSANNAVHANTAADADKAHSLHDETSIDNDISITPTFTVSDRYWIVKDTDHPNGFRLQPTDLSGYFTKEQSSTNATAKANAAIHDAGLDVIEVNRDSYGSVDISITNQFLVSPQDGGSVSILSDNYISIRAENRWSYDSALWIYRPFIVNGFDIVDSDGSRDTAVNFSKEGIMLYGERDPLSGEVYGQGWGMLAFPGSWYYDSEYTPSSNKFATVAHIEDATNGLAQTIPQKINAAVSANLNTYIDGETGVEYVGKFYGGSLYYVPTGNVYPPNN